MEWYEKTNLAVGSGGSPPENFAKKEAKWCNLVYLESKSLPTNIPVSILEKHFLLGVHRKRFYVSRNLRCALSGIDLDIKNDGQIYPILS